MLYCFILSFQGRMEKLGSVLKIFLYISNKITQVFFASTYTSGITIYDMVRVKKGTAAKIISLHLRLLCTVQGDVHRSLLSTTSWFSQLLIFLPLAISPKSCECQIFQDPFAHYVLQKVRQTLLLEFQNIHMFSSWYSHYHSAEPHFCCFITLLHLCDIPPFTAIHSFKLLR